MADKRTATVSLPEDYGTPEYTEAEVRSIVQRAASGEKLTTPQVMALQIALSGSEGIQDSALRKQASEALNARVSDMDAYELASFNEQAASIARQRGLDAGAYQLDSEAVAQIQNAGDSATRRDSAALGALGSYYGASNKQNQDMLAEQRDYMGGAYQADQMAVGDLSDLGQATNQDDRAVLADLLRGQRKADAADVASVGKLDAANKAVKYIDPAKYGADVVSTAAGSKADADAIAAQKDVLGEYEDLSDPRITASERFDAELLRRDEEQDQRAALGAAMRDLEARGIRSGGAEIGALLGSAQNTGQTRMLGDMALAKQAQQRAEAARASRAGLAGDIRSGSFGEQMQAGTAADAVATFNKSQSQTAARAADQLNVQQQQAGFDRSKQVVDTEIGATGDAYARAGDAAKAGTEANAAAYSRGQDVYDATTDRTDQEWNRVGDVVDNSNYVTGEQSDMAGKLADKTIAADDTGYQRVVDAADAKTAATDSAHTRATSTEADERDVLSGVLNDKIQIGDAAAQSANVLIGQPASPVHADLDTQLGYAELNPPKKKKDAVDEILGD